MSNDYYKTKESVEEYIELAKEVNGQQLINKLKKLLPHRSNLLEIGSGPGTDWKILSKDFNVVGFDNSSEFLNYLKTNNPKGKFIELDAVTLETKQKFDCIYSNKVLHHLDDKELRVSIKRQSEILNPGGIICHSFWKGEGTEMFKGLFVNYHSAPGIKNYFSGYFEVIELENYKEFDDNDSILFIGKKKIK